MKKTLSLTVALILALAPLASADTIHVTDDAFVNAQQPAANFGANVNLQVNRTRMAFLHFDLDSATGQGAVGTARLRLYLNGVQTPGVVEFHAILAPWSEATITAGAVPAVDPVAFTSIALATSQVGDYVTVDISPLVDAWLGGALSNHGIAIRSNLTDNTAVTFDSKENRQTSHGPELERIPAANAIPPGAIMMWSGTLSTIPTGWVLCDGTMPGVPNLTARFIRSVPDAFTNPGTVGGSTSHSHGAGSLSAANHTHTYSGVTGDGGNSAEDCASGSPQKPSKFNHTHTYSGTTSAAGGAPISGTSESSDHLPLYYELAFIYKL